MQHSKFSLKNKIHENIYGDLRYLDEFPGAPLVIIMHGFKAWKDWGYFPYVAEKLTNAGFITINMSSSLCGVPEGADDYVYPEKFASNTVTQEIFDIRQVIDQFINGNINRNVLDRWNGRIFLLGHSRGASVSLFVATDDKRINKLIAWSPIDKFVRFSDRQIKEWKNAGYIQFDDSRTGTTLRINKSYLDDFEKHSEIYNPKSRAAELEIPVLYIHGEQDVTVPYQESKTLFESSKKEFAEYILIKNTGHTFGIRHPFTGSSKPLEEVISKTIEFLQK